MLVKNENSWTLPQKKRTRISLEKNGGSQLFMHIGTTWRAFLLSLSLFKWLLRDSNMQPGFPIIGVQIPALITRNSSDSYAAEVWIVEIQRRKDNFPLEIIQWGG